MQERAFDHFIEKLEAEHKWPSVYMFKFIAPSGKVKEIRKLFPDQEIKQKASKAGNYYSVTAKILINSTDEVIRIYQEAYKIKGVIAL